jgi:glycerol dehydrogenase-like iron-containing ADH family enzyme
MTDPNVIGSPFVCVEADVVEILDARGVPLVVCANEPPWSRVRSALSTVDLLAQIEAWNMEVAHLSAAVDQLRATVPGERLDTATIVGIGGGTALDTAKYVAWTIGRPLVQVPSITSVDAGFTDAIGVRDQGRVRYIGTVVPEVVVLDLALVRSAPPRLNRAGVGDVLSCHTGLFDWRLASERGLGQPWHDGLAALGATLLDELEAAADEIGAVSDDGVRFLADAYRRVGAACAWAGHSRFEEGSEHFWAYAYEHATGAHPVHGEIIAFAVCALSHVQSNDPDRVRRIVERSRVRAHPEDLGVTESTFRQCVLGLRDYARSTDLDMSVVDLVDVTEVQVEAAWDFVMSLPHQV